MKNTKYSCIHNNFEKNAKKYDLFSLYLFISLEFTWMDEMAQISKKKIAKLRMYFICRDREIMSKMRLKHAKK